MTNRRGFLKFIGVGLAVAGVSPTLLSKPIEQVSQADKDYYWSKREEVGPGGWVSYRFRYTVTLPPTASMRFRDARGLMVVRRHS